MIVYCEYIDNREDISMMFNQTALEALLRGVEDDISIDSRGSEGYLDIRALDRFKSMLAIRDVIRTEGFILDLIKNPKLTELSLRHTTPYGRHAKRVWSSNDWAVATSKGWVVFDHVVHTQVS